MDNEEFTAATRDILRKLSRELSANPFAGLIFFDGKFIPRAQARAIERSLWPLAFPKAAGALAA